MMAVRVDAGAVPLPNAAGVSNVAREAVLSAAQPVPVAVAERSTRYWRMDVAVGVLAITAVVAALCVARAFGIPLLLGIFASYTLSPVADRLKTCRVPPLLRLAGGRRAV